MNVLLMLYSNIAQASPVEGSREEKVGLKAEDQPGELEFARAGPRLLHQRCHRRLPIFSLPAHNDG